MSRCERSSMAEHELPKLDTGVRFPSLAPLLPAALCILACLAGCTTTQRAARYSGCPAPVQDDCYQGTLVMASAAPARTISAPAPVTTGVLCHTVRPGETLWSISKTYNVDLDTLARANNIGDNSLIEKGQVLTIPSGATVPKRQILAPFKPRPAVSRSTWFAWPVRGPIVSRFGEKLESGINKGIDIRAAEGVSVAASRAGKVVYCDSQLKGFGTTVIIDHLDGFQTVYSYNSAIIVNVGDEVRQNQTIAKVGQSGRAQEPMLHFEIRKDGEPVDPTRYLAR